MRIIFGLVAVASVVAIGMVGCDSDETGPGPSTSGTGGRGGVGGVGGSGGQGGGGIEPPSAFDRLCGSQAWDETTVDAVVHELSGEYLGVLNPDPLLPAGTVETMKIIPEHPFYVTTLRVAFGRGAGTARIRLMNTFGQGYPGGWPDMDAAGANLVPPIELQVEDNDGDPQWIDIDVASAGVFLEPTRHYLIVYEHLAEEPRLAVEDLPEGESSGALIHVPGQSVPSGLADANFRMEARGQYFCSWSEADRWFGEDTDAPFTSDASGRVAIADLNGDGHEDVILNAGGPLAYFGDGTGQFAAPGFEPFADVPQAQSLLFGDLDNDGDRDAFASNYVSPDSDGDDVTISGGDCNDADDQVHPSATEVAGNGYDDDCDGVADDGTDTSDADADGVDIANGDCDDTRDTVYPGAPELLDRRDNDCNLQVDETFYNRILVNDGTGLFTEVQSAGVEVFDPSTAAAFGDGNADGFLDVYWGSWLVHYPQSQSVADSYYEGIGDGTFTDAFATALEAIQGPRACYGALWTDYNNDGHQDIWVGNYGYGRNILFENQGDGTFLDVAEDKGVHWDGVGFQGGNTFGGDFGDIDNDGDLDHYAANIAHPRYQPNSDPSTLMINAGGPDFTFENEREERGLVYDEGDINAVFADYDNDMDLDLAVGPTYPGHFSRLYQNQGDGTFVDVTYETHTAVEKGAGVAWSDVDEDGDLDLLIADGSGEPYVHLFINRVGQDNHWLRLDLEGTTTNRDGVGARVTLVAGGVTQIRDVSGGGGHTAQQQSRIVHFGLGDHTTIDSVTVRWVGGTTETISGLAADGLYEVVEGTGQGQLVNP